MADLSVTLAISAIATAHSPLSSPDDRISSLRYIEQIKTENIETVFHIASSLTEPTHGDEIRSFGCQLLQHMIRSRWKEVPEGSWTPVIQLIYGLFQSSGSVNQPWSIKSKAANLLADVVKYHQPQLLTAILPSVMATATSSPYQAELAALFVRFIAEDTTVHNEDIDAENRKLLLASLTESLTQILMLIYALLDKHFSEAVSASQRGDMQAARAHSLVVSTALSAALAYGEWAPVGELQNLITACCFLLQSQFRVLACDFLKEVAARRRSLEEAAMFDSAMTGMLDTLLSVSAATLQALEQKPSESELEFGSKLCETFVTLTPTNLRRALAGRQDRLLQFCHTVLGFFKHRSVSLRSPALNIWLSLLRDTPQPKTTEGMPAMADIPGQPPATPKKKKRGASNDVDSVLGIPTEAIPSILDVLVDRLSRKDTCEDEDFDPDGNQGGNVERGKLSDCYKILAAQQPLLAASKVFPLLESALLSASDGQPNSQTLSRLQGTHWITDALIAAIPPHVIDAAISGAASVQAMQSRSDDYVLGTALHGVIDRILATEWQYPALVGEQAHLIAAFGPYISHSPPSTPRVMPKLFSFLSAIQINQSNLSPSEARETWRARLRVCLAISRTSRAASAAFLPYLQAVSLETQKLHDRNEVSMGEFTQLGEALLTIGLSAGQQELASITNWLLNSVKPQWTDPGWHSRMLQSPLTLAGELSSPSGQDEYGQVLGVSTGHWWIFHTLSLFEKMIKKSKEKELHPLTPHLGWIVPPALQLLRCLHGLWSPQVHCQLAEFMQRAMQMSGLEKSMLLGEKTALLEASDGEEEAMASKDEGEESVAKVHSWLKAVRDSGYSFLGLLFYRIGTPVFADQSTAQAFMAAFLEHLEWMESSHMKLAMRMVLTPMIKTCPPDRWQSWIGPVLSPFLNQAGKTLSLGWNNIAEKGSVVDIGMGGDMTKAEVLEDKLLRDLSRETCGLLCLFPQVSPAASQPSEPSEEAKKNRTTMLSFVLQYQELTQPCFNIATSALMWPDSETVHRALSFCSSVVHSMVLEPSTLAMLKSFVGRQMFTSAIASLTLASNNIHQADTLGLLRDTFVLIGPHDSGPREVLNSLPSMTPSMFANFETAFSATGSAKEQRHVIRNLLMQGVGTESLKALSVSVGSVPIANLNSAIKYGRAVKQSSSVDVGPIGLALLSDGSQ